MPRLTRTQGLMAVGLGFAMVSCSLDATNSDLITEGNPRVITVTVLSESAGAEAATYCAGLDSGEKLNEYYCPTRQQDVENYPAPPVTDAVPIDWKLRLIFNEHLQADAVEDLLPCVDVNHNGQCDAGDEDDGYAHGSLANTQPVTLTCGGEAVSYDGYYQITGNHLTYPGGPALVIEPIFPDGFVATGTQDCQVTVNSDVRGKDNNTVDQPGPYTFGIADLAIVDTAPAPPPDGEDPEEVDPTASLVVEFNAYVNPDTLDGTILLDEVDADDNVVASVPITMSLAGVGQRVLVAPVDPLTEGARFRLTVMSGVEDIKGGALVMDAPYQVVFTTAVSM